MRDLYYAQSSNEGLKISYTVLNLFVLSLTAHKVPDGSKNRLKISTITIILHFSKIVSVTHSLSLKLTLHNVFLSSLPVQRHRNPIYRQYLTENILHSKHDKLLQRTTGLEPITTNHQWFVTKILWKWYEYSISTQNMLKFVW